MLSKLEYDEVQQIFPPNFVKKLNKSILISYILFLNIYVIFYSISAHKSWFYVLKLTKIVKALCLKLKVSMQLIYKISDRAPAQTYKTLSLGF